MLANLVSPEAFLLGLQMTTFLLCAHMTFSLRIHIPGVSLIRILVQWDLDPILMTLFNLHHLLNKGSIAKYSHIRD